MKWKQVFSVSLAIALSASSWLVVAAERPIAAGTEELRLPARMAKDPLAAFVFTESDLPGRIDSLLEKLSSFAPEAEIGTLDEGLSELNQELGFSLKEELLSQIGPEYGVVIDLPPLDSVVALMADPVAAVSLVLGKFGVVVGVRDGGRVDRALRGLFALGEAKITSDDGMVVVEFSTSEAPDAGSGRKPESIRLYYAIEGGYLALGAGSDWVAAALSARPEGERLVDGPDFRRVFEHLDASPHALTYLNLPKVHTLVEQSEFLKSMAQGNEELRTALEIVLNGEMTSMGLGTTAVKIGGGTRQSSYGPSELTGGMMTIGMLAAVAVPNFVNATDRGKQKRTMADIRSISIAMESYAVDTNSYPGPTDGWEGVESIASALSPVYIRQLPETDGWGHPLRVWSDGTSYRIVSPGKDGEIDRDWTEAPEIGPQTDFDADIVLADGEFIAWPEGEQQ